MENCSLHRLVSDLRALGCTGGPSPALPAGARPSAETLDRWARAAALGEPAVRPAAIWAIRQAAGAAGLAPASIQALYAARGRGEWGGRTVPALNLRGWTYATCCAAFRAARKMETALVVFEQALGEAIYAKQTPAEYTAGVLAAALREGHQGPVFLQADHDQVNAAAYVANPAQEIQRLTGVIREQVAASFFNVDIDASTVVDLSRPTLVEQQRHNAELTARFTRLVREVEPAGVTVSVGAEIGEVGAHNTTPDELRAFMATYPAALAAAGGGAGITKVSVNSGTHHGGKVLADGSLAQITVAFDALAEISRVGRDEFGLAGAVQHGASTLPMATFSRFPETGTVEIHLALGFNNLIFDHPRLPQVVKDEIREYVHAHHAGEKKPDQTEAQFLYTTRKKVWAGMKERFWNLPAEVEEPVTASLEAMFAEMFERLRVGKTGELVERHTRPVAVRVPPPPAILEALGR
ncbi:MAG TPA: class II fructose-bisphosphate aldolase [Candidatus Sulfotelmatobacter sp.]|nr:class II fructose-bisphosphate aldolase [Candidatus Sulfotelmatobacter sp.]